MSRKGRLLIALSIFALAACGGGDSTQGQANGNGRPGGGPGQRPEQPPVPIAVELAVRGDITSTYSANATLEANAQADILARVPGVVQSILVEEGDRVTKGQALLQIEADEYRFRSLDAALRARPEAGWVLVSVPVPVSHAPQELQADHPPSTDGYERTRSQFLDLSATTHPGISYGP